MISKIKVTLNSDLRKKYGVRSFPIAVGDIVKVMSGKRRGEGGKVIDVNHANGRISIEGVTIAKEDGKQEALFLRPEDLSITKIDFSRDERIQRLRRIAAIKRITIEEPEPEPEPAPEEEAAPEPAEVEPEPEEVEEADTPEVQEAEAEEAVDSEEATEEKSESEEEDDQ